MTKLRIKIPFIAIHRNSSPKIKYFLTGSHTQKNLTLYLTATKYTFFSSPHGIDTKKDRLWDQVSNLKELKS